MSRWLVTKIAAVVVALAVPAKASESEKMPLTRFTTEDAARAYLKENPTGQYAKLAFLALVEYRLMRENRGMTPKEAMAVFYGGARGAGAGIGTTTGGGGSRPTTASMY